MLLGTKITHTAAIPWSTQVSRGNGLYTDCAGEQSEVTGRLHKGAILKADTSCTCANTHDSVKESLVFKSRMLFSNVCICIICFSYLWTKCLIGGNLRRNCLIWLIVWEDTVHHGGETSIRVAGGPMLVRMCGWVFLSPYIFAFHSIK